MAHLLRGRPAGEPLWTAITAAVLAEFEPGPEVQAMPVADQSAWLEGLKVMVAEPALQGEMMRVAMVAEQEIAAAVAERTGTDLRRDMYPALVAAAVTAASNVAVKHYLTADPVVGMEVLLPAALAQFAAGLPVPEATTLPPGADASGLPAGVDASGLPAGVDASGLPAGVDASGLPAGADASGLPAGLSAQAADLPAFRAAAQGVGPPAG